MYAFIIHPAIAFGLFVGYAMGRWVDPDWDLMGVSTTEANMIHDFPVLGYFLFGYSSIYGVFFRRHHRSFITHFPFVSTLGRLIFLFWWAILLVVKYHYTVSSWEWLFIIYAFIGLSVADMIHWLLDKWFPDTKLTQEEYEQTGRGPSYRNSTNVSRTNNSSWGKKTRTTRQNKNSYNDTGRISSSYEKDGKW